MAYLGENRWAFSAITAHEVVFSCPIGSSQGPPQSLLLPPFEIFYVPPGCTARTEDWVFPASLDGRSEASLDPLVAPTLGAVGFNVTTFKSVAVIELPKANATSINFISDLPTKTSTFISCNFEIQKKYVDVQMVYEYNVHF